MSLDSRGHRSLDEFTVEEDPAEEPSDEAGEESGDVFFEEESSGSEDRVYLL
ncbi:hypothetical protein [Natrinema altunense]|uniref:hypothetical protein n=1 Tax=Natrinema altunense TaxID=222984 RepID=UPI00135F129C|nr:hypothetical protein [Natrinema altunense]